MKNKLAIFQSLNFSYCFEVLIITPKKRANKKASLNTSEAFIIIASIVRITEQ
jgi:hypothetical protein